MRTRRVMLSEGVCCADPSSTLRLTVKPLLPEPSSPRPFRTGAHFGASALPPFKGTLRSLTRDAQPLRLVPVHYTSLRLKRSSEVGLRELNHLLSVDAQLRLKIVHPVVLHMPVGMSDHSSSESRERAALDQEEMRSRYGQLQHPPCENETSSI